MQLNSISFTSTEIKVYNFDVLIKKKSRNEDLNIFITMKIMCF